MKNIFVILAIVVSLFGYQSDKNRGEIDMHGGKYKSYGGLSDKFGDLNLTKDRNLTDQAKIKQMIKSSH